MKHLFNFSLLLALILPASALAHDFEVDGIYYNFNGNEATVTCRGSLYAPYDNEYTGSVTIPTTVTYNGTTYPVTSIAEGAFTSCSNVTSVTIPNSVTAIGRSAFDGCYSLSSLNIPNSVTSIGVDAFYGTPWYESQPDGLVYAGLMAYKYKGTMPSGTSIIIREGTHGIADDAFEFCPNLTSITIPNSVTSIGSAAFHCCENLASIDIPNSVTSIGSYAFGSCYALTSITIPNSVTAIGDYTFWGCTGLTTVTIPGSVTSIGDFAFFNCNSMTDLYCYIADPSAISMGEDVFPRKTTVSSGCTLHVPNGTADAFQADKHWHPYFGQIVEDPHPNQ